MDEISDALEASGIELQMYHAEAAPGQYEVVTGPLPPLQAVDALIHTRETIYNIASKHGLRATLAPRVFLDNCAYTHNRSAVDLHITYPLRVCKAAAARMPTSPSTLLSPRNHPYTKTSPTLKQRSSPVCSSTFLTSLCSPSPPRHPISACRTASGPGAPTSAGAQTTARRLCGCATRARRPRATSS